MLLYLLRHEERPDDPSFLTELTENGKQRANTSLKQKLDFTDFTTIYSSSFIRVLQTIQPYLKLTNKKVCMNML